MITLIQIFLLALPLSAQDYEYEWTTGLFDTVLPNGLAIADITDPFNGITEFTGGVAVDHDGNTITTGFIHGTFYNLEPFEEVYKTSGSVIFVQKKDPTGQVIWSNYIDGGNYEIPSAGRTAHDIAVDSQNNIFICGRINNTTDFDTGPEEMLATSETVFTGFIAKYSASGEPEFVYLLEGGTDAEPRDIVVDADDNVLVAGIYEATVDFDGSPEVHSSTSISSKDDNFLLKIDNSGQYLWHKTWGGEHPDDPLGLEIDGQGNIYVACLFIGTIDTDPGPTENIFISSTTSYIPNSYVSKFDSEGNLLWSTLLKSENFSNILDLDTDEGSVCVIGIYQGNLEIGQEAPPNIISESNPSNFSQSIYVVKLNADGQYEWHYQPESLGPSISSFGEEISEYNGNWYVGFSVSDSADLDNSPDVEMVSNNFTTHYLVQLSENGDYQWNKKFEMDDYGFLQLHEIKGHENNLYIFGLYSDGALDTNPAPDQTDLQPSWFEYTTFLVKLSDTSDIQEQDPPYTEIQKVVSSHREPNGGFGQAVAISGQHAIVAASVEDTDENGANPVIDAGAAYIFTYDGQAWTEDQKIIPPDRAPAEAYGTSVDIEDHTAVFAGPLDGDDASGEDWILYAGSVTVFEKDATNTWNQSQKIVAPDRDATDLFGYDVSIFGDMLAISSPGTDLDQTGTESVLNAGGVYIYKRNSLNTWQFQQKIVASDRDINDLFGISIHLNHDVLVVGVPDEDDDTLDANFMDSAGSAYIFERDSSGNWYETQKVVASDRAIDDQFGKDVKVENGYLMVGASHSDTDENGENFMNDAGAVYIFKKDENGQWIQQQKIVSSPRSANDHFGNALAVSGNKLVISTSFDDEDEWGSDYLDEAGRIHVYNLSSDGIWIEKAKLTHSDRAAYDRFGRAVAIDNEWIISSAIDESEDEFGENTISAAGSAYFFKEVVNCSPSFHTINDIACIVYTSPSGNHQWNTSGLYTDTLTNLTGCDSVITIDLIVHQTTAGFDTQIACNEFTWIDGNTYSESTTAVFNISGGAANGCDSIVTLDLTILEPSIRTDTQTACNEFTWIDGNTYLESTTAVFNISGGAANGCDSIIQLDLTINSVNTNTTLDGSTISSEVEGADYQWLNCEADMSVIPGATHQMYTTNNSGSFAVAVTENGCIDTSACVAVTLVGVTQSAFSNPFTLYPNPAKDVFTIDFTSNQVYLIVRIYSVAGQLVEALPVQNSDHLDVKFDHPSGMYWIEIENLEGQKSTLKLIKH